MKSPTTILKQYFGYDEFRTGQMDVIKSILEERDSLAIMPTGAGKSLCFQVPAILMEGITLVISPLISLMQDQVHSLIQAGIPAAYINSFLTPSQTYKALSRARDGAYKIIYVAPERLEAPSFLSFAQNADISMVAVDEAHCVSHWGQDFRPSYLNIPAFVDTLSKRPILSAFTATATDLVKGDIIQLLGLNRPFTLSTGFNRENLFFEVRHPGDKFAELMAYLNSHKGKSGIIYCATRKTVDSVTSQLKSNGINASGYHAGMEQADRAAAQQDFIYDRIPIIVATNAFGMGIDKSNVSFVVHYNMPKNMENYYQEAGRAGRDGSPAECILLFSRQDIVINQFLIDNSESDGDSKAKDYRRLREMEAYCTTLDCLRQYILDYFQDEGEHSCDYCSNCRHSDREMVDVTIEAQKILSCIYRMKGRWGLATVIDVLHGTQTAKIKRAGLDLLKTFGIMAGKSVEEIRQIANYLGQRGYVKVTGDKYPVVQVAEKALNVLHGNVTVKMPALEETVRFAKKKSQKGTYAIDDNLLVKLKELRSKLAESEGVPAFVVFSDLTLHDMCTKLPTNGVEFLDVTGVGAIKQKKYGKAFLEAIQEYKGFDSNKIIPWEEHAAPQQLFDEFQFSEEPIHLSGFAQQVNILLMQIGKGKTSANALAGMLEKKGYLEMEEAKAGKRRMPTQKGIDLGIESRKVEGKDGRTFIQNFYSIPAQKLLLEYIHNNYDE